MRARDQLRLSVEAYRTLHECASAYGVRQLVVAEAGLPELRLAVSVAEERCLSLHACAGDLRARIDAAERRAAEQSTADERRRSEELAALRVQAQHMDALLATLK